MTLLRVYGGICASVVLVYPSFFEDIDLVILERDAIGAVIWFIDTIGDVTWVSDAIGPSYKARVEICSVTWTIELCCMKASCISDICSRWLCKNIIFDCVSTSLFLILQVLMNDIS